MARFLSAVVRAGLLLLCLWLSGCWAVWRYKTKVESYIIFSARTTIYLEYEGTSFVEWDISVLCSVVDKRSPFTTISCPVAGTHRIMPVVRTSTFEDKERYLTVNAELHCFLWYVYFPSIDSSVYSSQEQELIIWIYDPENADASEVNHTATKPPPYSRALSKQFMNLGLSPFVKTIVKGIEYSSTAFIQEGFWKMGIPASLDDIVGQIYGDTVTFQGCFVASFPFVIFRSETPPVDIHDISISSPVGSDLMLMWSACFPTTGVLVTDYGTFLTADAFKTSKEIKFPSTVLDRALAHSVNDFAIAYTRFFFLIGDSVYVVDDHNFYKVTNDSGVPESGFSGISARGWCELEYPEMSILLSDLLIWTTREIYYVYPEEDLFGVAYLLMDVEALKRILGFEDTVDLIIINACYDSVPSEIAILIACTGCRSSRIFYLVGYDEDRGSWFLRDFFLPAPLGVILNMDVLYSASSSMLLWDKDKVYYSYNGNRVNGYIKVSGTDKILSAVAEGTTIHQIIIDYGGNTLIKMKNNAMFFLKFNMKDVIRLNAWEAESNSYVFYVNPFHDLFLLQAKGSDIYRQIYPLKTEILSAVHPLKEVCPYISFQHSMRFSAHHLDMGEHMTFWAQIVFLENLGLYTDIKIYRPELLKQKTNLQYEIARGICTKNVTVTLYHEHDYSKAVSYADALVYTTGVMTIDLKPSTTGRTCFSNNLLSFIYVGCSPLRYLDIKKPSTCKYEKESVKIPAKYRWSKTDGKDLEIQYDMQIFGCPIEVYYADPFRPTVILYDNVHAIHVVQSNYALWEVNGRNDFHYNSTMEQVRCLREAQTISSMIPEDIKITSNFKVFSYWGPQNYKSCFVAQDGFPGDLNKPYEIMNHSGINSVIWPQYYTGIFMFRLIILDPNYSFCRYETYFAVRTYGIVQRQNMFKIAGWSILIVTLFLGVLIFSYFRYVKQFRSLSFEDPLLSLDLHLHATASSEEKKKEE